MFGTNEILKPVRDAGDTLRVVRGSPFLTVQGEGPNAGHPAVFIRLHGCTLACWFCDTAFSDPEDPTLTVEAIVERAAFLAGSKTNLVVITGGEPTRQPLGRLVYLLRALGLRVQIETAGSFWEPALAQCEIVVSPKTPRIHTEIASRAIAFKYVVRVGEVDPLDGLPTGNPLRKGEVTRLARPRTGAPVYLIPCDEYHSARNAANARLVAELAMAHGYIAGLQMHKAWCVD